MADVLVHAKQETMYYVVSHLPNAAIPTVRIGQRSHALRLADKTIRP